MGGNANYTNKELDLISGDQVGSDQNVVFANEAPQDTQTPITIVMPTDKRIGKYLLEVYNPSTVTDLTCKIFAKELNVDGANTRYAYLTSKTFEKSQAITGTTINMRAFELSDLFVGADLYLVFSNNTVLGAAEGFTAIVRLREII